MTEKDFAGKPGFRKHKKEDIADAKKLLSAAGIDSTQMTLKFGASSLATYKVYADQNAALRGARERNLGIKVGVTSPPSGYPTSALTKTEGLQAIALSNGGLGGPIWDDPLWHATRSTGIRNSSFWFDKKTDDLVEKQQRGPRPQRPQEAVGGAAAVPSRYKGQLPDAAVVADRSQLRLLRRQEACAQLEHAGLLPEPLPVAVQ